jgi:hypothetical protein
MGWVGGWSWEPAALPLPFSHCLHAGPLCAVCSLPPFPGKQLKILVDHNDPSFIEERRRSLDGFMGKLLGVPHVASMLPVQIFLGFFEQVSRQDMHTDMDTDWGRSLTEMRSVVIGVGDMPQVGETLVFSLQHRYRLHE